MYAAQTSLGTVTYSSLALAVDASDAAKSPSWAELSYRLWGPLAPVSLSFLALVSRLTRLEGRLPSNDGKPTASGLMDAPGTYPSSSSGCLEAFHLDFHFS